MKNSSIGLVGATALGVAGILLSTGARAQVTPPDYGSGAAVATVALTVKGSTVGGTPIDPSGGMGPPAYLIRNTVVGGNETILLPTVPGQVPLQLVVTVPNGKTKASGHRLTEGAGFEAIGKTTIRSIKAELETTDVIPLDLLLIKATHLKTETTATTTLAGKQTNMGETSVGALTISGALLGGQVVQLKGKLKPGVIFKSALITISVDHGVQGTSGTGQPELTVNGIDVAFGGGKVNGTPITGNILLSTAGAY